MSVSRVAAGAVALLRPTDLIRFLPDGKNGNVGTLTFRAWDQTAGAAGQKVTTATSGGTAAFSAVTATSTVQDLLDFMQAAMGIQTERVEVTVEGDMDLSGTLGISKEVPVGFQAIRLRFHVAAPQASPEQLRILREKTEQYCVVFQTLTDPPKLATSWLWPQR